MLLWKYSMPTWVCFCWPEPEEFLCVCLVSKFRWAQQSAQTLLSCKGILLQFAIFCLTLHSVLIHNVTIYNGLSLIKKKRKLSSYIRKFRRDRVQSHKLLTAFSYMVKYLQFPHILGSPSSYMTLHRFHLNFLIYEENFVFFFISDVIHCILSHECRVPLHAVGASKERLHQLSTAGQWTVYH